MKVFLSLLFVMLMAAASYFVYVQRIAHSKASILTECATVHLKGNIHYHVTLKITQDGKNIPIPAYIGIVGDCIHPVHTHDFSGLIHLDYPKPVPFTLGDVFDMQGLIFNDRQIGSIKTSDGYSIIVKVNGKIVKNAYREILLKEKDVITIEIIHKKRKG